MHTSSVKLRQENILSIAKDVIRPSGWNCEWNVASLQKPLLCRTVLNSWNAYLEHLTRHCHQNKGNTSVCRLPRCNVPSGVSMSSYDELINHIQQSHLSRVQLSCPIRGCTSISFSRPAALENHFIEEHKELIGQEVPYSSPLLVPLWRPYHPDCSEEPTPLPGPIIPGSTLIPPIKGTSHGPLADRGGPMDEDFNFNIPGSQRSSQLSPIKHSQLQPIDREENKAPLGSNIVFDDLPDSDGKHKPIIIWQKPPMYELSHPQDILDPGQYGPRIPPGSILYQNFLRIQDLREDDEDEDKGRDESQNV